MCINKKKTTKHSHKRVTSTIGGAKRYTSSKGKMKRKQVLPVYKYGFTCPTGVNMFQVCLQV